jgi:hypothetical protein
VRWVLAALVSCGGVDSEQEPEAGAPALLELPLPAEKRQTTPAVSLTASDGTGLALASLRSKTVIEDPLVLTELELAFDNPEDRTLEGRFAITLPEGASISRFAMEIGGQWQEGEVVEKKRARTTYESFLHKRRDPALMEKGAGNQFTVRVFPIPPRAKKRLLVTYSEVVDPVQPFSVRLAGLPEMDSLDVEVFVGGDLVVSKHEKRFVPTGDLQIGPTSTLLASAAAVAEDHLVSLRVRIPDQDAAIQEIDGALLLVDTSAGRARDLEAELEAVAELVAALPADTKVLVAGFDQEVHVAFEGTASAMNPASLDTLRRRRALGASDLGAALASVRELLSARGLARVIVVSDGIAAVGSRDDAEIARRASALAEVGVRRIDALAMGSLRSTPTLRRIAEAGPERGIVLDLQRSPELLLARLRRVTLPELPVEIPGALWQSVGSVGGAQPGDSVVVHAALDRRVIDSSAKGESGASSVALTLGGTELVVPVRAVGSRELLERAHAVAKIADLEARPPSAESKLNQERDAEIVALSTRHRVLARGTAMLVLETEQDYATFGIDRAAKVDVLTIDGGKITTAKNARPALQPAPWGGDSDGRSKAGNLWGDQIGDAFGAGGLGLSGIGEGGGGRGDGIGLGSIGGVGHGSAATQGFGSGSGRLGGAHRSSAPRIRMGSVVVDGPLPPEVIQRIVRQNFGRFRMCYERDLAKTPTLAGRLTVRFVIQLDGSVKPAVVASREWNPAASHATFEQCVTNAFVGLSFPQPEGRGVTVLYPLTFEPPTDRPAAAPAASPSRGSEPWTMPIGRRHPILDPTAPIDPPNRFAGIQGALATNEVDRALREALAYHQDAPSDILAYVALGEVAEAAGQPSLAARAYGSIVDLWGDRAELRRFAAERLERIGQEGTRSLAVDVFETAVADRADQPSGHRLLAYAKLAAGDREGAFRAIERGLTEVPSNSLTSPALELMRLDAGVLAAALLQEQPGQREEIEARLTKIRSTLATEPSTRFVLHWETDANDVDLHVTDAAGHTANFHKPDLRSGGRLFADVTTGFGPEGFVIPGRATAFPYSLRVHYYARGPMGFGMGKVQIVCHDGAGGITLDERPFVIQSSNADVELGKVPRCGPDTSRVSQP